MLRRWTLLVFVVGALLATTLSVVIVLPVVVLLQRPWAPYPRGMRIDGSFWGDTVVFRLAGIEVLEAEGVITEGTGEVLFAGRLDLLAVGIIGLLLLGLGLSLLLRKCLGACPGVCGDPLDKLGGRSCWLVRAGGVRRSQGGSPLDGL